MRRCRPRRPSQGRGLASTVSCVCRSPHIDVERLEVPAGIRVSGCEVVRERLERHVAAVGRDRGSSELLSPLAPAGPEARLTSVVVWVARSRTKTSRSSVVSSGWRFVAAETKATRRPSAEMSGAARLGLKRTGPRRRPVRPRGAAHQRRRARLQVARQHHLAVVERDDAPVGREVRVVAVPTVSRRL